jgi:tRNA nucleotidyltransferase (CCA-adding enzyme)
MTAAPTPPGRDDPAVAFPTPEQLIASIRGLPAAVPLLDRLRGEPDVYLVGGAVRDLLRGARPLDLDLVVEGDASALAARLGPARHHDRFGTSTVVLDGRGYDLAQARTETYARPGALPDVAPARLDRDLLRRDFTVNAMAVALGGPEPGTLHAAPRGREDLAAKVMRVLHDRSFIDDPTRLLRLVRYASRLGFAIEPHTLALARAAAGGGALGTVTGPRIGAELRLLAREEDPVAGFELLAELGLDRQLAPGSGLADGALARRALALLPADGRRDVVVLALAGRGLEPEALRALLDALAFEAADRNAIVTAAAGAEPLAAALAAATTPAEIAAAVGVGAPELVAIAGALGPERQASDWLERLRAVRLEIDGDDLLGAGVPRGPAVGRGLRAALAAKLDGRASGRAQELSEAVRGAGASG